MVGLVACAIPVIVIGWLGWRQRWVSDDGWINIRVLEQFFAGNGLTYNVNERVEVTTSTLWLWMLILGHVVTPFWEFGQLAVLLGTLLSVVAVALGVDAARRLPLLAGRKESHGRTVAVPFAALAFVAIPPVWDFVTSGLETGLTFCWLAASFWLLVRRAELARSGRDLPGPWRPVAPAVVIGLGPLVRPDLALVSAAFAVALLVQHRFSLAGWLRTAGVALAVPLVWEIFRAGYYATLVPNTALAKSAAHSDLAGGFAYLSDYAGLYRLWVPMALSLAVTTALGIAALRRRDLTVMALLLAPVVGGVLHGGYVTYIGGDFMHGRMLLPATMAVLLPCFAVCIGWRRAAVPMVVALIGATAWSLVIGIAVRTPYGTDYDRRTGIANERTYWNRSQNHRLVKKSDLKGINVEVLGRRLRSDVETGRRYYFAGNWVKLPAEQFHAPGPGVEVAIAHTNLGILGVTAGNRVLVADIYALSDPVAARLEWPRGTEPQGRAGHVSRPESWRLARYAAPNPNDSETVRDARIALTCGELDELQRAVTEPMTPQLFLANLVAAPRLTLLRVPADATAARQHFCG